jgi:uncharacterized protein
MQFTEARLGRVFVLRLSDGDRLPDALEAFAAEKGVSMALCFFLGGAKEASRVIVGPKDGYVLPPEPMVTILDGVHEACGLGTLFLDEAKRPRLHMHAGFGRNGKAVIGCVRMGVDVWRIGEIVVLELIGAAACRVTDEKTGFEFLEIR